MREIKFRVWDNNIMYYNVMVGNPPVNPSVYVEGHGWSECTEDAILMQYTGLKDVNGKEIYEGDIVKANKIGKNYEVKFKKGAFCAGDNLLHQFVNYMDCEVIGNIYNVWFMHDYNNGVVTVLCERCKKVRE